MKNGLDKKYLRDPDGGINLLRKKAEAGLLTEAVPDKASNYPLDGYNADLARLPKVSFGTVWKFMIETVASKKQVSTVKPLVKGFNFFKSKHVLSIGHRFKDGRHFVKSTVLPSMKKSMVYTCYLALSSLRYVIRAKCACPAGKDGRCNHVAATLFACDEVCKRKAAQKESVSCTSKPCTWSVPPKRKGPAQPISRMKFHKHDYEKKKRQQPPLFPPGKDVRAPHQREWPQEKIGKLLDQLKELHTKTGQVTSWSHILTLNGMEKNQTEPPLCPSSPKDRYPVSGTVDSTASPQLISPVKKHPISIDEIKHRCDKIKKKLFVTKEEAAEIEINTRRQSSTGR